jgi:hypothetical protein
LGVKVKPKSKNPLKKFSGLISQSD